MVSNSQVLTAVSYVCGTILTIGVITFLVGFFGNVSNAVAPIGIGTVMGAVFIFLMGNFFITTQEVLEKLGHEIDGNRTRTNP